MPAPGGLMGFIANAYIGVTSAQLAFGDIEIGEAHEL